MQLRSLAVRLIAGLAAMQFGDAVAGEAAATSISRSYAYLTSLREGHGGALRAFPEGPLKDLAVPYSFTDDERYWGEYVCRITGTDCRVEDLYDAKDFALKPRPGPGSALQTERVNVHNGTNIYDAATWQIAVVLGASINRLKTAEGDEAYALVSHQNAVLSGQYTTRDVPLGGRATTTGAGAYVYGKREIRDPAAAYAFRMTAAQWLVDDPFKDTPYASFLTVGALPPNQSTYQPGRISWSDWKPVTGENAWAFLLGPLQAAALHYELELKVPYIPPEDRAIKNALDVLPAFAAMQSAIGAIYYAPGGTSANVAGHTVDPYMVSVENNLSAYAGLGVLQEAIARDLAQARLDATLRERLTSAQRLIVTMVAGGELPGGVHTDGVLSFLRRFAWDGRAFVQGGYANDPSRKSTWIPLNVPRAVDVNTWGIAALRPAVIDDWFGFGTSFETWSRLKDWAGYGSGRSLAGVGYSDADGNGRNSDGTYKQGVLSAEWTAGAIVAVRSLIMHYQAVRPDSPGFARARQYLKQLQQDEASMTVGLQSLRLDHYASGEFPGKPVAYQQLIARNEAELQPYVYASKRYYIPFGWFANPIPSTCATAWALMVADRFDPFVYGGGLISRAPDGLNTAAKPVER